MNNYPEFVEVNNKRYKINTDFRVAINCNEIAQNEMIGNYERALAIIYLLFGEDALNDYENHLELMDLAITYLSCGKKVENTNEEPDMDFIQDMDYIEASFMSDYHIDLSNVEMHWWKFMKLMNGLSNSELGNCCVLNAVRNLRNYDVSQVKDDKERQKIIKAKESVALNKKEKVFTKEQEEAIDKFNQLAGI